MARNSFNQRRRRSRSTRSETDRVAVEFGGRVADFVACQQRRGAGAGVVDKGYARAGKHGRTAGVGLKQLLSGRCGLCRRQQGSRGKGLLEVRIVWNWKSGVRV